MKLKVVKEKDDQSSMFDSIDDNLDTIKNLVDKNKKIIQEIKDKKCSCGKCNC